MSLSSWGFSFSVGKKLVTVNQWTWKWPKVLTSESKMKPSRRLVVGCRWCALEVYAGIWTVIYRWQMVTILWVSHCKMCWAKRRARSEASQWCWPRSEHLSQLELKSAALCWSCPIPGHTIYPAMRAVLSYILATRASRPQAGQEWALLTLAPLQVLIHWFCLHGHNTELLQDAVTVVRSF